MVVYTAPGTRRALTRTTRTSIYYTVYPYPVNTILVESTRMALLMFTSIYIYNYEYTCLLV